MIKIKIIDNNIIISGHANFNDYGKDIVCASVSSIVTTTVNAILRYDNKAIEYQENENFTITILKEDKIVNLLITNMLDLFSDLENQYPKNIRRCWIVLKLMQLNIQLFAHKKGQGSTKNGRDSISKRLGAKASDGEYVTGGSIIYRQRGTKIYPGVNVGIGSDDTVYAKIDGYVKFERKGKDKKQVSVYPSV